MTQDSNALSLGVWRTSDGRTATLWHDYEALPKVRFWWGWLDNKFEVWTGVDRYDANVPKLVERMSDLPLGEWWNVYYDHMSAQPQRFGPYTCFNIAWALQDKKRNRGGYRPEWHPFGGYRNG